ncbi:MAG TPA: HD-GYP domain-containing protein [Solirubrobacteraceae bacterium]|nr:HD-GYP domain-containing protein [Solirubrobacteraceae bacterium]
MSTVAQGKSARDANRPLADGFPEVREPIEAGRPEQDTSSVVQAASSNVNGRRASTSLAQLVQVSVATMLVAGVPVAIVWWLRASGAVSSAAVAVLLGMGLSLTVSQVACLVWENRRGSEDLLFSELMIWGFLHRWRTQRRLASARELLGPISETQRSALNGVGVKDPVTLLERLVARMETRDPYLHGHSRRVARHSWMIARRMGLSRAQVARIRTAAALHDVGKINTPKTILHKAGPLSHEEYDVIKRHPGDGARMVAVLHDAELTAIVRDHHERLDGSGYPHGLSGDEIPIGARIVAVADTFDAITSVRSYRPARTHRQAIEILKQEAAVKLDPAAVRAFCSHYAGRQPLVLWSVVAGLPERVLSRLAEGAAGVASMAKVVAVAALIGGAAATSSTLGLPLAKHQPTKTVSSRAIGSTLVALPQPLAPAAMGARHIQRVRASVARARAASSIRRPAASAATGTTLHSTQSVGSSHVVGPPPGRSEQAPGKRKAEGGSARGRSQEAPRKGRPEAPPPGHGEPAKGSVRLQAAPADAKPEHPAVKAKPEEVPAAGKGAPAASGERALASADAHGAGTR